MPKGLADLAELPVTVLKGVGPERAKTLEKIDIETVLDVVTHYPRRYIDKTKQSSIRDLRPDESTWVFGRVVSSTSVPGRGRGKARTELRITDGSGYLRITFFNQPWRTRQLPEGSEGMFFGKVTEYRGQLQMANPEIDLLDEDDRLQIAAIYPQSDKLRLYSKELRALGGGVAAPHRSSSSTRCRDGCSTSTTSSTATRRCWSIHQPETMREAEEARRRLVFDELLRIQLALVLRKRRIEETSQGIEHNTPGALVERFLDRLPVRAHRRPGEGDRRGHGRPGPADPDAPPAPRRRGRRQDRGRHRRAAHRRAGRAPGRLHGAHRGAGRAAPRQHAAVARRHDRAGRRRDAVRRAAADRRAAHQPGHRQGAPARARWAGVG